MPSNTDSIIQSSAHRPFPIPNQPWVMTQTWSELLFAHWPVSAQALKASLPASLEVDTFDGTAWLGIIPLRMSNVCPRGLIPIPWVSNFLELNVRTYVTFNGKPGVYFFSLDASNPLAVWVARTAYLLPYFQASMRLNTDGQFVHYYSKRTHSGSPPLTFEASYRPTGSVFASNPGSIEYFFTERYCLYVADKKGVMHRCDIHHIQWPLQPAEAEIKVNSMAEVLGLDLRGAAPLLHFAQELETIEWAISKAT